MNKLKRVTLEKECVEPFYLTDPKYYEIYKKCIPPRESYYYFPKGEEIIVPNKKPIKSIRRVFYKMPYTNDEKQWLIDFKQLINSKSLKLPYYFDDYLLLAFIYSSRGKLDDSFKRLIKYIKFSNETFPMEINPNSKIIEILNKGFIYIYGRDNRFRPILVCQSKVFQKLYKNYQTEELLNATNFLMQFLVNHMLVPGKFETLNMIINMTGVSIISLPEPLKRIIPELSQNFLCRLYKNYIIGLTFFTRILYKIAVNFLDKVTVSKITVLDKKKDPALFKSIRRDNVEEQFGGTAPNMPQDAENGFFPPRMPSEHFIKEEENVNDILITEDEYIDKYKKGEIPEECVSPYIYEKLNTQKETYNKQESIKTEQTKYDLKKSKPISNISYSNNITKSSSNQIEGKSQFSKNTINLNSNYFMLKKQSEKNKIKHILNNGWDFQDESPYMKYNTNTVPIKHINLFNEINQFGKKKQKFCSKISLINSKNSTIYYH
jgi:hypothetical protein